LEENCIDALKLLEMMHHAQLMYTSCGWFFDELSGLESTQILQYARRAITHGEYFGLHLENIFQNMLEQCPSNKKEYANGRDIYQKLVLPEKFDCNKWRCIYRYCRYLKESPKSDLI
jgi:hypothetical protein